MAYVRGKMTKKKVLRVQFSEELKATGNDQVIHSDVMTVDGKKSLLLVCVLLQLTVCTLVKYESEQVLGTALQGQLQSLREREASHPKWYMWIRIVCLLCYARSTQEF